MNVRLGCLLMEAIAGAGVPAGGLWMLCAAGKDGFGSGIFAAPEFWIMLGRYTLFSAGWLSVFLWAAARFSGAAAHTGSCRRVWSR
jgi:hypothetical protein